MRTVTFTRGETRFFECNEIGRLATITPAGTPHVVPVSYVFEHEAFWIAVDYNTKKHHNLKRNKAVAFLVDTLKPNRAVMIQGSAKIFERGPEFKRAYKVFRRRFSWVKADPWEEGEAPFVKIIPLKKASWGFH
jgi:nitroimidazol reductase NimA-like FMN-containing flavoprotein (pyridoxamine 5'-phosphate oxidase superfamily)